MYLELYFQNPPLNQWQSEPNEPNSHHQHLPEQQLLVPIPGQTIPLVFGGLFLLHTNYTDIMGHQIPNKIEGSAGSAWK